MKTLRQSSVRALRQSSVQALRLNSVRALRQSSVQALRLNSVHAILFIIAIVSVLAFPQKKYIAGSDSILTYANLNTAPGFLFVCIKDSNNSFIDTLVAEIKNPFGNWVQVGVRGINNGTYFTSIRPGNNTVTYYQLNFGKISPGEFRVRRTNVANRTIKCQVSIERRDFD